MNILIINHYAGSLELGMEFRPYYFAKEWIKMGHRVDIIAADYSHLRRVNPKVDKDFQQEIIDGIRYHWIKTGNYDGNGVKRAATMAKFVLKLWFHASKIMEEINPDVVIDSSTYPLDTYVGQRIRKKSKKKVKVIHEVHDMWPISPIEIGGMSPKHPFIKIMQWGENSFCRNSDLIVSLLPKASEYLHEHGMEYYKFEYVPNGVFLDEWYNAKPLPNEHLVILNKLKNEKKFIISFFGSHTKSYCLDILIEAVKKIKGEEIGVVFIGNGVYKDELIDKTKGYSNIFYFMPSIPKESIPSLFKYIDATYVAAVDNSMFRFGICMNKMFDSMMGGKPILYAVNAPNNYIKDYNCGISVKAEDVDSLAEGINELINMTDMQRKKLGDNGKNAALKFFNYSSLSKKFIEIIKKED